MAYKVTIHESGFVFTEITDEQRDIFQLKNRAHRNAVNCIEPNGAWKRADLRGMHLMYYYESAELDHKGERTGETLVHIYLNPRLLSDDVFYRFVNESKPDYVGAIHL